MPATSLKLHVGCDITVRAAADCPIVAMLRPASGLAQWLSSETYAFDPWVPTTEYVDVYGNLCQRMVVPQGEMRLRVEATVETEPELAVDARRAVHARSRTCPTAPCSSCCRAATARPTSSSRARARSSATAAPGYGQVEAIRAWIQAKHRVPLRHQRRLDRRRCDARARRRRVPRLRARRHRPDARLRIPARMVVGYLLGLEPMDLHAWFEAYVGGRWYTFDATQAEPRGGRVVLAYGRDAADVAFISNYGPLETVAMQVWVEIAPPPRPLPPAPPPLAAPA